jgi:hypothetical protein
METKEAKASPSKVVRGVTRPLAHILSEGIVKRNFAFENAQKKVLKNPTYENIIALVKALTSLQGREVVIHFEPKHKAIIQSAKTRLDLEGFETTCGERILVIDIPRRW